MSPKPLVANTVGYSTKRLFDILLALAIAPAAIVIVALGALVVVIEARANPFFVQTRIGEGRRKFKLIKLRTMSPQTADLPSHQVGVQSILKSGGFLRRTKVDELPQLWNVLNGTMSFVGPRPCLPSQTELLDERERRGLYQLRPGITGPAQIAGIDMSTPRQLAIADATYLASSSLGEDLAILARTFTGAGSGDGVTKDS